jgi:hypothetical protein
MTRGRTGVKDWARRARLRATSGRVVTWAMVPVLALAVTAGGRDPVRAVLADTSGPPTVSSNNTTPPGPGATVSPGRIRLPATATATVRQPASVSGSPVAMSRVGVAEVPTVALVAYQRAAQVIDAADTECHLSWTLLAAIGQVESDHGQVDGSHLNAQGVASPPILGPVLNGRHGVGLIRDTDRGQLDGNRRFDRALGPMQFLPSTWAVVGVDGDGDGQRNVQDINDAALGAAVYLCAGQDNLSSRAGRASAVFRYNHSHAYVTLVLSLAHRLRRHIHRTGPARTRHHHGHPRPGRPRPTPTRHHHTNEPGTPRPSQPTGSPTSVPTTNPTGSPTATPAPSPTDSPSDTPTGSPTSQPTDTPSSSPTNSPTAGPSDSPSGSATGP